MLACCAVLRDFPRRATRHSANDLASGVRLSRAHNRTNGSGPSYPAIAWNRSIHLRTYSPHLATPAESLTSSIAPLRISPALPQQSHTNVHPAIRASHTGPEPCHLRVCGCRYALDERVPEVGLPRAGFGEEKWKACRQEGRKGMHRTCVHKDRRQYPTIHTDTGSDARVDGEGTLMTQNVPSSSLGGARSCNTGPSGR